MSKTETVRQLPMQRPGPSWEVMDRILANQEQIKEHLMQQGQQAPLDTDYLETVLQRIQADSILMHQMLEELPEKLQAAVERTQTREAENIQAWNQAAGKHETAADKIRGTTDQLRAQMEELKELAERNRPPGIIRQTIIVAVASLFLVGPVMGYGMWKVLGEIRPAQVVLNPEAVAQAIVKNWPRR